MKIFYTINPHINNLSMNRLLSDFRYTLQKYYRKQLGQRYYKKKSRQFKIGIFPEVGNREMKQPHLHMLIDIPMNAVNYFRYFVSTNLKATYPSLTDNLQEVKDKPVQLWSYCLKEDSNILTNEDLYALQPTTSIC